MIKTCAKEARISQGDIFRNVEHIESIVEKDGELSISKIVFPYVMVLTQDCDLEQDHFNRVGREGNIPKTQDKHLLTILVAPIYNLKHFLEGMHLSELGITMRSDINWKKSEGKFIQKNEVPRYHFLEFGDDADIVDSIIDFKHYFSVNTEYLRSQQEEKYVISVEELFREQISHRFSFYLSRIGLPEV